MIARKKSTRKTLYLLLSLGVVAAIVGSSVTLAAGEPQRAYGQVMPPSMDSSNTTTATAETTTTADATATAEATVTVEATTSVEATLAPPIMTVAPKPVTVIVPSVMGKPKAFAVKRLKSRKLKVKIARVYSAKKVGTVVAQSPVRKRRRVGTTVYIKVGKRWPSGFKTKAASDRFWKPYVVAAYKQVQHSKRFKGSHTVYSAANVRMTLKAIWGESRGSATAGLKHHDGYLGLLQMSKGYGSTAQRLDPIYEITRMGRGIKKNGASWARSRWSTI